MAFKMGPPSDADEHSDMSEINIIPLVDVILVLLIIFMVAAPLSITGINVQLPTSKAKGTNVEDNRIVLTITGKGDYYLEKTKIPSDALEQRFRAIYESREKKDLYIRADHQVSYGRVVDAMSAAKIAGVTRMSMLTEPPRKG